GRFEGVELEGLDEGGGAFLDAAAVMASLDLVVSADTAGAHLAGALGGPCWGALCAGAGRRWAPGRAGTARCPASGRARGEDAGDWKSVFERMAEQLRTRERRGVVTVEVSPAEALDRLTILEIKAQRIEGEAKRRHVRAELAAVKRGLSSLALEGESCELVE